MPTGPLQLCQADSAGGVGNNIDERIQRFANLDTLYPTRRLPEGLSVQDALDEIQRHAAAPVEGRRTGGTGN